MAESTFGLRIIATNRIYYDGRACSIVIPTSTGQRGILPHHEEMICAIDMGVLRFRKPDGEEEEILVGAGSLQTANNRVIVLVDTAETRDEIDERRAEEAAERARERLRQKKSIEEYRRTQAALARALSRLKFKGKSID